MSAPEPLEPAAITITAVQFVGTNVEMTYLVDAPGNEAEARLDALFAAKLGLYAITATGSAPAPADAAGRPAGERDRASFSVIASPLDRLFHKIGPPSALTLIKHASLAQDLSEINLTRQAEGLLRTHADDEASGPSIWPAWDVGKLLGSLLRRPSALRDRTLRVAGVDVAAPSFPNDVLPTLDAHVAEHGGVRIELDAAVLTSLADVAG